MPFSIPYLLSIITFLPLVGAIAVALIGNSDSKKQLALLTTLVTFVVSLMLLFNWDNSEPDPSAPSSASARPPVAATPPAPGRLLPYNPP